MGKYDDAMHVYLDDKERFADFFNGVMFQGESVLRAEMLESDSERYVKAERKEGSGLQTQNRFRDIKKRLKNGDWLAIATIENQENIDYTMPLRMMEYDCLEYVKQVKRLKCKIKKRLEESGMKASNWSVRLDKEDRLYPVHSICFYHGTDEWTGPESLKDMMDFEGALPGWEEQFHDYGMTLFCANQVEDFSIFKTELRQLLEVIPCRKSKRKLKNLFEREEYKYLDRDTAEAIAIFTDNTRMLEVLEESETEGGYNMCQALEELVADGRAEGRAEGKAETLLTAIRNLMNNMSIAAEQAMEVLEIPMEERAIYLSKL